MTRGLVSISVFAKATIASKLPAEAKSTPGSPGRGFLCAILADPQTNARAGRNPSLKILPQTRSTWSVVAPPVPTLRPARARRPRPTPRRAVDGPRRRGADVPGPVAPGNGGSRRRELSHLQVPDAGRGPADRTGGGCAPETPDRWLCGPPPRHRRRPPPQPDRPAGPRGLTLLRQTEDHLLSQRRCDRCPGSPTSRDSQTESEAARRSRISASGISSTEPSQSHWSSDPHDLYGT